MALKFGTRYKRKTTSASERQWTEIPTHNESLCLEVLCRDFIIIIIQLWQYSVCIICELYDKKEAFKLLQYIISVNLRFQSLIIFIHFYFIYFLLLLNKKTINIHYMQKIKTTLPLVLQTSGTRQVECTMHIPTEQDQTGFKNYC